MLLFPFARVFDDKNLEAISVAGNGRERESEPFTITGMEPKTLQALATGGQCLSGLVQDVTTLSESLFQIVGVVYFVLLHGSWQQRGSYSEYATVDQISICTHFVRLLPVSLSSLLSV